MHDQLDIPPLPALQAATPCTYTTHGRAQMPARGPHAVQPSTMHRAHVAPSTQPPVTPFEHARPPSLFTTSLSVHTVPTRLRTLSHPHSWQAQRCLARRDDGPTFVRLFVRSSYYTAPITRQPPTPQPLHELLHAPFTSRLAAPPSRPASGAWPTCASRRTGR